MFIKGDDIIQKEAEKLLKEIRNKIRSGSFENNTKLTYEYKEKLLKLYDEIEYPKFTPCYAIDTLLKDEYNTMISTLYSDIESSLKTSTSILEIVEEKTSSMDLIKRSLVDSNRLTEKSIENLKDSVEDFSESGLSSFVDSFNEDNKNGMTNKSPQGFLTLPYKAYQDLTSSSVISVIETNGLPGNTHVASESYSNITYDGEIDPMFSLGNIIDNNNETRFECEIFDVSEKVYEECNGAGFLYKEGVSWLTRDNKLYLKFRVNLKSKQIANWFSVSPYIPPSSSYISSIVKSITISDGSNDIKKVVEDINFDDVIVIPFKERYVKYVDIVIEQEYPYDVEVAHDVITKLTSNKNYLDSKNVKRHERVNVPIRSVSSLGVKYNPNTKEIEIPSSNERITTTSNNLNNIFGEIIKDDSYEYSKEIINAKRYNIAISNINIGNYTFEDDYTYTSKVFECDDEINSITLNANDSLDDENIKYMVTLDDGATWIRLYPKERAFKGPCCIKINSTIPIYERDSKIVYIDKLTSVKNLILKIELTKPKDKNNSIPIVYDYRLNVESGGEKV